MNARFHVAVLGAGLVGASTALALERAGLNVALIEPHALETNGAAWDTRSSFNNARWDTRATVDDARWDTRATVDDARWDTRIYAISPGSEAFLDRIGAWKNLDAWRVQAVFRMDVHGDREGAMVMDAYEAGVPKLASILESGHLQQALWQAVQASHAITVFCPAEVSGVEWGNRYSTLTLTDGPTIEAELIVGAEGRASPIRTLAGIESRTESYNQSGVVANFAVEIPHRGTAFQWFKGGDVIAYLPLPGNRMSLVWSTSTERAKELVGLSAEVLCEQVKEAGRRQLGKLELLTPAVAFPLSLMQVSEPVRPGVVLVGDAAHGVHPLAGQGVNLGFGDAECLAEVLSQRGGASCGDLALLQRHARRRAEPVARMQAVTDGLLRLFKLDHELPALARNLGMSGLNRIGPLKSALIHEAFFN
jgi:2-octaprenyl-6-methoxyphenol hydroxylase